MLRKFMFLIFCVFFFCQVQSAAAAADEPQVAATEAVLIEAETGRVIWEKNADEKRTPASMTKIMTCILALENLSPHGEIMISQNAAETEDVAMDFQKGDLFEAVELEYAMMLLSDNGAAVALAEEMAGSAAAFAGQMNEKARELGMKDTNFVTPNGLTAPGHYSTARDMAKLARYAMHNEVFRDIVGTQKRGIRWLLPKNKAMLAENTNELLGMYRGMTGIKTGWTQAAGGCLAASARRNGVELIAVVMNSDSVEERFVDARKILDYGFAKVKMERGVNKDGFKGGCWVKDGRSGKVDLALKNDIDYPLIGDENKSHYRVAYDVPKVISAPLKAGEPVGRALILYDGHEVGSVPVVAAHDVPAGTSLLSLLVSLFEPLL